MKYRVKVRIVEEYTTWVEADSEEVAEELAMEQLRAGDLSLDYESTTTEIIDVDDSEDIRRAEQFR